MRKVGKVTTKGYKSSPMHAQTKTVNLTCFLGSDASTTRLCCRQLNKLPPLQVGKTRRVISRNAQRCIPHLQRLCEQAKLKRHPGVRSGKRGINQRETEDVKSYRARQQNTSSTNMEPERRVLKTKVENKNDPEKDNGEESCCNFHQRKEPSAKRDCRAFEKEWLDSKTSLAADPVNVQKSWDVRDATQGEARRQDQETRRRDTINLHVSLPRPVEWWSVLQ